MTGVSALFQLAMVGMLGLWCRYAQRQPRWPQRLAALLALIGSAAALALLLAPIAAPRHGFFAFLRFAAWGLFLHGSLIALCSAWIDRRRPISAGLSGGIGLGLLAVAAYAFQIEPRWLELTQTTIPAPGLLRPLRVGVVADLQSDDPGAYERRALLQLKAQQPDLVLFCGDYVQAFDEARYRRGIAALNRVLREVDLDPPLGAFAVPGDVDWGFDDWSAAFAGTRVTCLQDTTDFELGELRLTALSYGDSRDSSLNLAQKAGTGYWLLFGHRPEMANSPVQADLLVAGHTHGGQVQLPWIGPLTVLAGVPLAWGAGGLTELSDGRRLYVSRGIGMERGAAPRLRFLCRPELAILELVPKAPAGPPGP